MIELDTVKASLTLNPPSNLSDTELLRMIDNEYPALSGPLRMVVERFRQHRHDQIQTLPTQIACVACGTELNLVWSEKN